MPRKPATGPTEGELAILRVLWERGPSTVRMVHEALGGDKRTGYTSTLKLMQIMTEKGLVLRNEKLHSHIYTSAIAQEQTQRKMVGEFVDKVFGGSARKLILQALAARKISTQEIEEIKLLLEQRGGGRHDND